MMTVSPSKHDSGHHKVTEKEEDKITPGKETWRTDTRLLVVNSGFKIKYSWRKMGGAAPVVYC